MKSKKAAMEMSVGTIVTIVLLMSVLVLGIFLVQKVFSSGTNAIDSIDDQVQSEINKLFSEEGNDLVVYPSSYDVTVKKGDTPKGFAFSVKNTDTVDHSYTYRVYAESGYDFEKYCGVGMTAQKATGYILLKTGGFDVGKGDSMDIPEVVRFAIPDNAPPCTIPYRLEIKEDGNSFSSSPIIYVTIK